MADTVPDDGGSLSKRTRYVAFLITILTFFCLTACSKAVTAATNILPGGDKEEGRTLFSMSCAKCHDEDAEGDGPHHSEHLPPPANLTLIRDTPDMAFSIVQKGVPGTAMPAFSSVPRGVFDKVMAHVKSQPLDTNSEWDHPWTLDDPEAISSDMGRKLYVTACSGCHGMQGRGDGHFGNDPRVWPKPADFHARNSNLGRVYWFVTHGRGGTMMAPQADKFPEQARWAMATYVHALFDESSPATIPVPDGKPVKLSNPLSKDDEDAWQAGHETYQLYCVACHGAQAKGSFLAPRLIDRSWKYGGGKDTAVFTVIEKGIPGKLMPGHKQLDEQRRWQLVTYIRHRGGEQEPILALGHGHGGGHEDKEDKSRDSSHGSQGRSGHGHGDHG